MIPLFKQHGAIIISIIGALGILAVSWWAKGTEYNDTAWFYAFCVWLFLFSAFGAYSAVGKRNSDK